MALSVYIMMKRDYLSKAGTYPLYLGILVNNVARSPIPLGLKVKPEFWNDENQIPQVKKGYPGWQNMNVEIINALAKGLKIIQRYQVNERVLTYERFLKEWGGVSATDFEQLVKDYIARLQGMYSEAYILKVGFVMGKITKYRPAMDLEDIDYKFIKEYEQYLTKKGNGENTIYSNFRIFRRVLDDAFKQDLIRRNPFDKIKLQKPKVEKIPLELDDVKKYEQLLDHDIPYYLHKTLCWFLLAIYTGRRYGDLVNFFSWEIKPEYIRLIQDKTIAGRPDQKVIIIFLNDRIRKILQIIQEKRYAPLSNQNANKFLKELTGKLAGIDRVVTFHLARHTFNHINKKLRTNAVTRQELLGHDSLRSTQVYEKPDPEQMQEAMQKWNSV